MEQWFDKYLPPQIGKEKFSLKRMFRYVKDFWQLLIHSLSPHEFPKEPKEKLPNIQSPNHSEIYSICKDMYNSSNDRIDKLEDKAIKLLSYITALFALISFAFLNIASVGVKYILLVSMLMLLLSIIISFRCVNVKGRKSMFLPSIYDFTYGRPIENFDLKIYSKKMLEAAVFNQNVADNTADLLKAARNMLILAIALSAIAVLIGAFSFNSQPKPTVVKIDSSVSFSVLENKLNETNNILNSISKSLDNFSQINRTKIDDLAQKLNASEEKYNDLLSKLRELEKRMCQRRLYFDPPSPV
ncbi:hypothetical protein [Brevibacillus thermoruber]|uniref:hypothetical protein n=1 Tax=Brevibacillus thermoruber TaxID=33942 RepID=UPI0005599B30|nr:hypothetical protein [Brevibacillus thermoruber]